MALSDQQVSKQIEHMIQFIKNESAEKVDEIHAKVCECTTFYPCYCYGLLGWRRVSNWKGASCKSTTSQNNWFLYQEGKTVGATKTFTTVKIHQWRSLGKSTFIINNIKISFFL